MKNLILSGFILIGSLASTSVFAASEYQSIFGFDTKDCVGVPSEDYYLNGFHCRGLKKEIYYINDKEVTKAIYDIEGKNGPLCDGTYKENSGGFPEEFATICVKGEYGKYFLFGKKVGFIDFLGVVTGEYSPGVKEKAYANLRIQLNKQLKELKSLKTFTASLKKHNENDYKIPIKGSKCMEEDSYIYNGSGYKNLVCEKNKVISVDYYLSDEKVTYDVYVTIIYTTIKYKIQDVIRSKSKMLFGF